MAMLQEGFRIASKVSKHMEPDRGPVSSTINFQILCGVVLLGIPLTAATVKGTWDSMKRMWFK